MQVIVLGAGVIGVTSAWYLAKQGHEVTLVDRRDAPGLETSYANAGQLSYGYSAPWAAPGVPLKALRWMVQKHGPLRIRLSGGFKMVPWLLDMLVNCGGGAYRTNKGRMVRLAEYSRGKLAELRSETRIAYAGRQRGTLQVLRDGMSLDALQKDMSVLSEIGVRHTLLSSKGCLDLEPGLAASSTPIAGGLHLPDDETGDAHLFTVGLASRAEALGVRLRLNSRISRLEFEGERITGVVAGLETLRADAYVVALGSYSPRLLSPLGVSLPVYPVKGYSLTATVLEDRLAPQSTVMDEAYKVAITRLGDRIRIGGTAELAGFDLRLRSERREALEASVTSLFPQAAKFEEAAFWCGLRPMTPDGTPVVSKAAPYSNLYLNTGHGTLGWTMACGSGALLADIVSGRSPDLNGADYTLNRYVRPLPPSSGERGIDPLS